MAALARRVLDHQVLAGRALDGPAGHLQVPADPVLAVHDVVAWRQLKRVDAAAPPDRHPAPVPGAGLPYRQVSLAQHREPDAGPDESALELAGCDHRNPRLD